MSLKSLVQLFAEKFLTSKKETITSWGMPNYGGVVSLAEVPAGDGAEKTYVMPFDGFLEASYDGTLGELVRIKRPKYLSTGIGYLSSTETEKLAFFRGWTIAKKGETFVFAGDSSEGRQLFAIPLASKSS